MVANPAYGTWVCVYLYDRPDVIQATREEAEGGEDEEVCRGEEIG